MLPNGPLHPLVPLPKHSFLPSTSKAMYRNYLVRDYASTHPMVDSNCIDLVLIDIVHALSKLFATEILNCQVHPNFRTTVIIREVDNEIVWNIWKLDRQNLEVWSNACPLSKALYSHCLVPDAGTINMVDPWFLTNKQIALISHQVKHRLCTSHRAAK